MPHALIFSDPLPSATARCCCPTSAPVQLDAIMARRGLGDEATAAAIHKLNAVPSSSAAGEDKAKTAALALAAGTPPQHEQSGQLLHCTKTANVFFCSIIIFMFTTRQHTVCFWGRVSATFCLFFNRISTPDSTTRVILCAHCLLDFGSARRGRGCRVAVKLAHALADRTRTPFYSPDGAFARVHHF